MPLCFFISASGPLDTVGVILPRIGVLCGTFVFAVGFFLLLRRFSSVVPEHGHSSSTAHLHRGSFVKVPSSAERVASQRSSLAFPIGAIVLGAVSVAVSWLATDHTVLARSHDPLGTLIFVIGLGLILGMRHSTDPDHVVAISTIVSKQRSIRSAAVIGCVWGLGHTITIFLVGSLIILFGVVIPPRLGLSMEFSVAIMLVLLGLLNLTGVMQKLTTKLTPGRSTHLRSGEPNPSRGIFARFESRFNQSAGSLGLYQWLRPLVIGLVHGLAGSAAVALLVLSTIRSPLWATLYLIIFGAGTMIGMMIMTAAIATPLAFAGDRFNAVSKYLGIISGAVSLCFGCFLIYQLGFLGGLFGSHPTWTPS
jgi:high-affinity nickel permease